MFNWRAFSDRSREIMSASSSRSFLGPAIFTVFGAATVSINDHDHGDKLLQLLRDNEIDLNVVEGCGSSSPSSNQGSGQSRILVELPSVAK